MRMDNNTYEENFKLKKKEKLVLVSQKVHSKSTSKGIRLYGRFRSVIKKFICSKVLNIKTPSYL